MFSILCFHDMILLILHHLQRRNVMKNRIKVPPSSFIVTAALGGFGLFMLGVMTLLSDTASLLLANPNRDALWITVATVALITCLLLVFVWLCIDALIGLALSVMLSATSLRRWITILRRTWLRPDKWLFRMQVATIEWLNGKAPNQVPEPQ